MYGGPCQSVFEYTMIQSTNFIVWTKWNLCQLNGKLSPMCSFVSASTVSQSVSQSVSESMRWVSRWALSFATRNCYVRNAQMYATYIQFCTAVRGHTRLLIVFSFWLVDLKSNAITVSYDGLLTFHRK